MYTATMLKRVLGLILFSLMCAGCSGKQSRNPDPCEERQVSSSNINCIDRKYLAEGFISDDVFRVVVISSSAADDKENMRKKAMHRARLSLERTLSAGTRAYNKNIKTKISNLIETSGQFIKKDIPHRQYDVYYFEITKKDLKNYLKNVPSDKNK